MKQTILLVAILCCTPYLMAQTNIFEEKAAIIASRIDSITTSEKSILKKEIKKIDKKVEKNEITADTAEVEKKKLAAYHAKRINAAVFIEEQKLQLLIKNKVRGKLERTEEPNKPFISVFEEENFYNDSISGLKVEKRFTTQFVFALGINTVLNGGDYYGDGFKVNPIGYGELGFTFKYRLKENTNLWNLKFGLSMMTDEIRPKEDNDVLVTNGNQTTLEDIGFDLKKSRLNNLSFGIPVHLELDFSKPQYHSKTEQTYLRSQRGFRLGLGGFFSVRTQTSQFIKYKEGGKDIKQTETYHFNMNSFNFGPSVYFGYRDVSIYAKYDMNPVFKDNPEDINTLSIGLRVDIN
ncbi:hypothetical protein DFQ09_11085 [Winogradskyella pacifica]|uniref:Outer membrane protein with beta-barrel domain n=1 Tax=Winogradskyella pacifica TaxID=664642 RepID=A0A3D9LKG8_9FLAO|nr:hypothetical protein [Winogradskyella pacifica]REE07891.1 hypothetical protein DFQ09_11085 [Winogradskyella pacifica]